jgi:hypothetical protein
LFIRCLCVAVFLTCCWACQGDPAPAPVESRSAIEVIAGGKVSARVMPGHPCRATVAGIEFIVGGLPLLAQQGDTRWTAETRENGTTFKSNDRPVARIHANQLFDAQGIPLVKVLENGNIVDGPGRVVRKAVAARAPALGVTIKNADTKVPGEIVVTNTDDIALAALFAAPEPAPEIRALAACFMLLSQNT